MPFYAVARGEITGIFRTWNECKESVIGYSGAKYKRFETEAEAKKFIEDNQPNHQSTQYTQSNDKCDYFVYTDGACSNNGKQGAKSGIGVYFGVNDPRNVSRQIPNTEKQTNNVAELTAIIEALKLIRSDVIERNLIVGVVTDSEYVIKCVSSYGDKCDVKGWPNTIPNRDLVREAHGLCRELALNVRVIYTKGHDDADDPHARGNKEADRLAVSSIM